MNLCFTMYYKFTKNIHFFVYVCSSVHAFLYIRMNTLNIFEIQSAVRIWTALLRIVQSSNLQHPMSCSLHIHVCVCVIYSCICINIYPIVQIYVYLFIYTCICIYFRIIMYTCCLCVRFGKSTFIRRVQFSVFTKILNLSSTLVFSN